MTVREADIKDAAEIAEIGTDSLGYPCEPLFVENRIKNLDSSWERVFVAENEGKVIGFIQVEKYLMLCDKDMLRVVALSVANGSKNMGAGRKLMEKAEEWGKSIGSTAIVLNSAFSRKEAHAFYEHIGFTNIKDHKTFKKEI